VCYYIRIPMDSLVQVFVFAFGAVIGSFLNAAAWRLRTKESIVRGRSHCTQCRRTLGACDLVPIVSWLLLAGRCRYCRQPISPRYLVVEAVTGTLFVLAWMAVTGGTGVLAGLGLARLLFYWYVIAVLVLVFEFDRMYLMILPEVVGPAAAAAFAAQLALGAGWFSPVLGAVIAGGFFRAQYLVSRGRWIGGGDAWLGLFMGVALGWQKTLLALFLAYVSGAVVASLMLLFKRKRFGQQLAFGTFLSAASVVALLFGDAILAWYLGLAF
jgi:leader peptidase (prepilin peptidase)/N-methyltransferase